MLQCLHPVANDVEENPGPTIFHIIDPTSADSSFFQLSAGEGQKTSQIFVYASSNKK